MFRKASVLLLSGFFIAGGLALPLPQSVLAATNVSVFWVPEPGAAAGPWVEGISASKSAVYLNEYLITDKPIVQALVSAADRGVNVRVIADAHPFGDPNAVGQERAEFAKTKVQIHF